MDSYLFTVDFAHPESNILDTDHSEIPHEHKCAHIIALDDGNYAAQPNNRCIWDIPSFTVKDNVPDWKVQTSEWNVENTSKWKTEDTDNFFYEMRRRNMMDKCKNFCCRAWEWVKGLWNKWVNWILKVSISNYGFKNFRISSCTDAYENGCQLDRDNRNRHLGLFWHSRKA